MLFANIFHIHDLKLLIVQMCGFSERHENDIQIKVSHIFFRGCVHFLSGLWRGGFVFFF